MTSGLPLKREATARALDLGEWQAQLRIVAGWVDGLGQRWRLRLGGSAGRREIGFEAWDGGDIVGVGEGAAARRDRGRVPAAGGRARRWAATMSRAPSLTPACFQRRVELAGEQRPEFRADAVDGREPCLGRGLLALIIHEPARGLPGLIGVRSSA